MFPLLPFYHLESFSIFQTLLQKKRKWDLEKKSIGLKCQACHLMTVVEEIIFQKYSFLASHHLHGRIVFPCPIDFGFGHVTCFGQWNVGKHNESEDLQCTLPSGNWLLHLLSWLLPGLRKKRCATEPRLRLSLQFRANPKPGLANPS